MKWLGRTAILGVCLTMVSASLPATADSFPDLGDPLAKYLRVPDMQRDSAIRHLLHQMVEPSFVVEWNIPFFNGCLIVGEMLNEQQRLKINMKRALEMCHKYEFIDWVTAQRGR